MRNNSRKLLLGLIGLYLLLNLIITLFWTPDTQPVEPTNNSEPIEYVGIAKDDTGNVSYWIGKSIYGKDNNTYKIIFEDNKYIEVKSNYFIKIPVYKESDLNDIKAEYNLTDKVTTTENIDTSKQDKKDK